MRQIAQITSVLTKHLFFFNHLHSGLLCQQRSIVQFTNSPTLALSSCESSFSATVLNWGCFHTEYIILFISYSYVLGTFVPIPILGLCLSLSILGALHPLPILECIHISLFLAPLCLPFLGVSLRPPILGVPIWFTQTRV